MIDKHAAHGARARQRGVFDELRVFGIEFRYFAAPPIREPYFIVLIHDHAVGKAIVSGTLVTGNFPGRAIPLGDFVRPRQRGPDILLGIDERSVAVWRLLGFRIVRIIFYFSGFAIDSHKSGVPGGPDISTGILNKAVPSKLRSRKRVVRPGGGARVHLADLQAARVDVPNVSILAEVRVVESALSFGQGRNVILDEHGFAQRFLVDGRVGNGEAALLAFRP